MFGTNWIEDYIRAGSSNTPQRILAELAANSNARIRLRVAENPATPRDVLERLARDPEADVRLAVGTNPSVPVDIVYALALDESATVRHGLAEDPNIPSGVLKILARDDNAYVSVRAKKTIGSLRKSGKTEGNKQVIFAWPTGREKFA